MKQKISCLGYAFTLIFMLLTTSCGKVDEKDLIGSWTSDAELQGFNVTQAITFDKDGTFTEVAIPTENDGIGFEVKGTWELSGFGKLKLQYHVNSLKTIAGKTYYKVHDSEDSYLSKMKRKFRNFNDNDEANKIEFKNHDIKLVTAIGENTFEESDEDTIESMIDKLTSSKDKKSGFSGNKFTPGESLPTSGDIHQFDYLSTNRLTHSDISGYSNADLRLLRNAIYAMHNYDFISEDLQDYFGNFDGYRPVSRNVKLNKTESANVSFIQKYE